MAKEKKVSKTKVEEKKTERRGLVAFFQGVKNEFKRVHWPSKDEMVKYSIATFVFVIFCALFFYAIDVIFALIQSLI